MSDEISTEAALNRLIKAFKDHPGYAWAWHCNIAMCAYDEGVEHIKANEIASRFMKLAFGVSTSLGTTPEPRGVPQS